MTLTGLAADSTLAGGGNPRLGRRLAAVLAQVGVPLRAGPEADAMLTHLRQMYEPFVSALADRLLMPLPPWLPPPGARDVWQVTAWGPAMWSTEYEEVDDA